MPSVERPLATTVWDDKSWAEPGDNAWARGLRLKQAWWRAQRLHVPPGPIDKEHVDRLVNSTLPIDDAFEWANFLTEEAKQSAQRRLRRKGGGLVKEDRLKRNLLSSQPLCFNLFGHLEGKPNALLGWVQSLGCAAAETTRIELEWAPPRADHFSGGSAFDAFVEYKLRAGGLGFVSVECKYAEDLSKSDVKTVRSEYMCFTRDEELWRESAASRLDARGLRQLWLNTLLAQSLLKKGKYLEGRAVVAGCDADLSAQALVARVQDELVDPDSLRWQSYETLLGHLADPALAGWKATFADRYLDFAPIHRLLSPGDPRLAQ